MSPSSARTLLAVLAAAVVAATAGCSGGGDGDSATTTTGTGVPVQGVACPIQPAQVGGILGYTVEVEGTESRDNCTYVAADQTAHPGAQVTVVRRRVSGTGLAVAQQAAQNDIGPTTPLPAGLVDGADGGYVVHLGIAVQVAVQIDSVLITVGLADAGLDPDALVDAGAALAGAARPT